jgi:hypothetical protein
VVMEDSLRTFEQQGFAKFFNMIPAAVIERLQKFITGYLATVESSVQDRCDFRFDDIAQISEKFKSELASLDNDLMFLLSGQLPTEQRLKTEVTDIFSVGPLLTLMRQLIGNEDIFGHLPPMVRFVYPDHSNAGVPPHIDKAYNTHMSDFVTVWIPLVEIDKECGGVKFYSGDIGTRELLPGKDSKEYWHRGIDTSGLTQSHFDMKPGDILVFRPDVIHGSAPNISERIRYSLDLRIFSAAEVSTKHYMNLQDMRITAPGSK